jgi:hypothetical protein
MDLNRLRAFSQHQSSEDDKEDDADAEAQAREKKRLERIESALRDEGAASW